jgi:hypothetical protein
MGNWRDRSDRERWGLVLAERAIDEAKQSNAGVTAPVELKTAEDTLAAARATLAKGGHDEAMRGIP